MSCHAWKNELALFVQVQGDLDDPAPRMNVVATAGAFGVALEPRLEGVDLAFGSKWIIRALFQPGSRALCRRVRRSRSWCPTSAAA